MNESYVTLQGWVGGDVDLRDVGETQCASFRVGSTPRYFRNGGWVDGQTSWFTVNCWRGLGKHVKESLQRGDAVVGQRHAVVSPVDVPDSSDACVGGGGDFLAVRAESDRPIDSTGFTEPPRESRRSARV